MKVLGNGGTKEPTDSELFARRLVWDLAARLAPPRPPRPTLTVAQAVERLRSWMLRYSRAVEPHLGPTVTYTDLAGQVVHGEYETWPEAVQVLLDDPHFDDGWDFLYELRLVRGTEQQWWRTTLGKRVYARIVKLRD